MNPRRRFIAIAPWYALGGVSLLAACSEKAPPPAPVASPAPAPMPAAEPAPMPAASPAPMAADASPSQAATGGAVSPSEPQAVALGYVALSTQADKTKFPAHMDSQVCSGCALYSGAAGAKTGPCSIFAGRQVNAQGWCSAWVKKA